MNKKNFLWALPLLVACEATPEPPPVVIPTPDPKTPVTSTEQPTMPVDHPDPVGLEVASRGPRRLSVEQLERTLEHIADLPAGSIEIPENLALTMGKPDFLRVTEESLDPSPLYMKFIIDLGGFYCTGIADADLNAQTPRPEDQRLMNRYPASVDDGLEHMLLMFTGIEGEDAAPYVVRLRRAYDAGAASALGARGGWEAACLALFTSPEFLLY
ncbi:MAG: hypothetical protein RIT81_31580 [Deltaproteobacteria bacterium]